MSENTNEKLPVSAGHIGWVAGFEYFKADNGDLYRAHKTEPIEAANGRRAGRFFSTAAVADKMLAHLGLVSDPEVEARARGYERRKNDRISRLEERAEKADSAGSAAIKSGHSLLEGIPMGQPILVGHHSERGDRARRSRATSRIEKGVSLLEKARHLAARANAASENSSISSDDPLAIQKLTERLSSMKDRQEWMKLVNKHYRSESLGDIGFTAPQIEELTARVKKGYSWEQQPYPRYELSNLSANIRRLEQRLEELQQRVVDEPVSEKVGYIRIEENIELNRVQVRFPRKPPDDVRERLSKEGFRWSGEESAWQAQRSPGNLYKAEAVAAEVVTGRLGASDPDLKHFEDGQVLFGILRRPDGTWTEERCMSGSLAIKVLEGWRNYEEQIGNGANVAVIERLPSSAQISDAEWASLSAGRGLEQTHESHESTQASGLAI